MSKKLVCDNNGVIYLAGVGKDGSMSASRTEMTDEALRLLQRICYPRQKRRRMVLLHINGTLAFCLGKHRRNNGSRFKTSASRKFVSCKNFLLPLLKQKWFRRVQNDCNWLSGNW